MHNTERIGFIGTGVMGEPMCRNLARKSTATVVAFDRDSAPLQRLAEVGVTRAATAGDAVQGADIVFLSLPSGEVVEAVCMDAGGVLERTHAGQRVIDLSTSPVHLTRRLAERFAERGAAFIDAPVARTRAAAEAGTLSITVGATTEDFDRLRPWLAHFAADITHCGPVGCGQAVKILNNMVLFETVMALCEAKAIGERAGVNPAVLFDALSKGSADSFALRNHGMKAVLPGVFPERAFSVAYAQKDLRYALTMAAELGITAQGARAVEGWFERALEEGLGEPYWPVISRLIERG